MEEGNKNSKNAAKDATKDPLYLSEVDEVGDETAMSNAPQSSRHVGRKRESGAALRRRKREALINQNLPTTSKRAIQETSPELNPAQTSRFKRAKEEDLAYRDIVVSFPMAIAPIDYPASVMYAELLEILKKFIIRAIDRIPAGDPGPAFVNIRLLDGAIIVSCLNQSTAEWLSKTVSEYGQNGFELKCMAYDELPKIPTYRLWIPEGNIPFTTAMERLQKQNLGLNTSDWKLLHNKKSMNGQLMVVQTGVGSVQWITENGRKLFFGMFKNADIHPVKKEKPASEAEIDPENLDDENGTVQTNEA